MKKLLLHLLILNIATAYTTVTLPYTIVKERVFSRFFNYPQNKQKYDALVTKSGLGFSELGNINLPQDEAKFNELMEKSKLTQQEKYELYSLILQSQSDAAMWEVPTEMVG